ncbi:disease resistance protein RPV1-like [Prosopis cineraria]|uniref:disease resistance protein RPV1-like n=1 Tax=Prosopis cineraria TaxID=364024 RepID=UPI00240EC419|nr:disease resistance protein RPV1-like [Prosopis cineraria]
MGIVASSSSSSSSAFPSKKYDVFISFRGDDTRTSFTSHLYAALCRNKVETYIDYRLHKGDEISPALIQAIKDSTISLVVLSQHYASSKWCLDELAQILQSKRDLGQIVIPVFYKVDPSDVRKQQGACKEAFAKHERAFRRNLDMVNKCRNALSETANLAGWDSQTWRDESKLIQNVVNDVLRKLNNRYPFALKDLVGIDGNCQSDHSIMASVAAASSSSSSSLPTKLDVFQSFRGNDVMYDFQQQYNIKLTANCDTGIEITGINEQVSNYKQ